MNIQLIHGHFDKEDALELLTQLMAVKIRFHENKIMHTHNEEDIKMREMRIKQLQNDLHEVRKQLGKKGDAISLRSEIEIDSH